MAICICDISALELLRSRGKLAPELLDMCRASTLRGCGIPGKLELEDALAAFGEVSRPCHLMIRADKARSKPWAIRHEWRTDPPPKALIRLSKDILVESPELLFFDLASSSDYDVVDLALVGLELCGTYLLDNDQSGWDGFVNIDMPMTSRQSIGRIAGHLKWRPGLGKAREAMGLVVDGCHSPMESVLLALLTFPRRLGGLGLSGARANYCIATPSGDRFADIAFPELKVVFEYKGRRYHLPEQAGRDDRRQNSLVGLGWTVVNVWYEDLVDPQLFARLESVALKAAGKRDRIRSDSFRGRQQYLRTRLIPRLRKWASIV